jgi:hypothetical protein
MKIIVAVSMLFYTFFGIIGCPSAPSTEPPLGHPPLEAITDPEISPRNTPNHQ